MRIAICDKDPDFREQIEALLNCWATARSDLVVRAYSCGTSLINAHRHSAFDIILLDPEAKILGGIEVARKIRVSDKRVKLVFFASSADYAVESYTVKASNYLLKPIDSTVLVQCMDELEQELGLRRQMAFKGVRATHYVTVSSIEYLKALGKHVAVALSSGEIIESNEPLYSLQERLSIDDGFFQCHRGHIVNINYIASCTSKEIIMKSGKTIPISRGCRSDFKKACSFMTLENER